jgi:hypothetical protein
MRAGAIQFKAGKFKERIVCNRQLEHLQAMFKGSNRLVILVWWIRRECPEHSRKPELISSFTGQQEVGEMGRIEGAPEKSEAWTRHAGSISQVKKTSEVRFFY